MPFTSRKFLGLARPARAKKLADLLGRLMKPSPGTNAGELIDEYNRLCAWNEASDQALPDTGAPDLHVLYRRYLHWRERTGMGPEREILERVAADGEDRDRPLASPLAYDVWLHDIRGGHNVGSVMRIVDAMGLGAVHRSGFTPGPDVAAVRAAAMGCETWIPNHAHATARDFLLWLENERATATRAGRPTPALIGLETTPDAATLGDFDWPRAGVLLVGNEELGIEPESLRHCDHVIRIPLYGRKASMNLATAFAIVAHDLRTRADRR